MWVIRVSICITDIIQVGFYADRWAVVQIGGLLYRQMGFYADLYRQVGFYADR